MEVRPTVFVGLGSSGIEIIKEFRRFMFEQFTVASLPIFRYIGVETIAAYTVNDDLLPDSFVLSPCETIHLINAIITGARDIDGIRGPELDGWLDHNLLNLPTFAVMAGAGAVRMQGRLALWKNAPALMAELHEGHNTVTGAPANAEALSLFAANPSLAGSTIGGGYDIYIMGTLCGGSCSGMFLDVAYMAQRLFNVGNMFTPAGMAPIDPAFHGIFTVLDDALAVIPTNKQKAANCWAALLELDYFMDRGTVYDHNLPGMPVKSATTNSPFNAVELVSRKNLLGQAFAGDGGGLAAFDGGALNRMTALAIFNNVFGGLNAQTRAIKINCTGDAVLGQVPKNGLNRTKTIISFGASAFINPKHRHAQIFACEQGMKLCGHWARDIDHAKRLQLAALAKEKWNGIRDRALAMMLGVPGGLHVAREVGDAVTAAQTMGRAAHLPGLGSALNVFPNGDPILARLSEGGRVYGVMAAQVPNARLFLTQQTQQVLDTALDAVTSTGDGNPVIPVATLPEMLEFIAGLETAVTGDLQFCSPGAPPWTFKPPTFSNETLDVFQSRWLKMLGLAGKGVPAAKDLIVRQWAQELDEHWKAVRRHLVRAAFENVINNVLQPFRARVENFVKQLMAAEKALSGMLAPVKAGGAVKHDNIEYVSGFPTDDACVTEIVHSFERNPAARRSAINDILNHWGIADPTHEGAGWTDLFSQPPDKIAELIRYSLGKWALLNHPDTADVSRLVLAHLAKAANPVIENLAKRSFPYLALQAGANPTAYANPIDFICGSAVGAPQLQTFLSGLANPINFNAHTSPLQHMVVLHRQLGTVYADDLLAANQMKLLYNGLLQGGHNIHIHYKQASAFDKDRGFRLKEVTEKLWCIQEMYPFAVFSRVRGQQRFFFVMQDAFGANNNKEVTQEADRKNFCEFLAEGDALGQQAKQLFEARVQKYLGGKGKEQVQSRMNQLTNKWGDQQMAGTISGAEVTRRTNLLRTLFSEVFPPHDDSGMFKLADPDALDDGAPH